MITWYARNDVPYSGGEKQLSITFPYIKKEHIKVFVNDVETTEYHFLNESQIFLDCSLKKGDMMSVRRNTPIDEKLVNFTNTSILNAEKQNLAQTQLLNAVQEIYDNNIEFQDETTAQVAAFEARVEEVEATTAESANIVAESAVLSASALANSEQAVTTANSAYDTATEALLTSEQANSFATEARDSATMALDIAVTSGNKVDVFEESIETVLEAADKITVLEGAVGEATEAAQAAQEAVQAVGEMIDAIDGKANVDLDNLSEVGQAKLDEKANINLSNLTPEAQAKLDVKANAADVLDKSQITNCLLEVPQRIKYTLVDGTLTIKAGSVVIYPFGTEDLTAQYPKGATFLNDNLKVYDTQFVDGKFFVWAEKVNDAAYGKTVSTMANRVLWSNEKGTSSSIGLEYCFSGTTAPTGSTTLWYDTTQNIIKRTTDSGATWTPNQSFLLIRGAYTKDYGFNTIDQIFNGMGYIGSTLWVDKGVKGLIPNGRNEDGTLKGTEFTTSKVLTTTRVSKYDNYALILKANDLASATASFDEESNFNKNSSGGNINYCIVGSVSSSDNKGQISFFNVKQPFRAVDYNDYRTEVDSKVSKSGDTMTGNLTVEKNTIPVIYIKNSSQDRSVAASNDAGTQYLYLTDKNNELLGSVGIERYTNGRNTIKLQAFSADGSATPAIRVNAYANNTIGCDFPKCTTKATTTSSARTDLVAVVTQNYVNGTSWYRVWSDGWKEQGGRVTVGSRSTATVTLLKAYSNTYYLAMATAIGGMNTGAHDPQNAQVKSIDSTSQITVINGETQRSVQWYACGY